MTRKRFVKLCMSKGYSRNTAYLLARDAQENGTSYENALHQVEFAGQLVRAIDWEAFGRAMNSVNETVGKIAAATTKAVEAAASAFREALES